MDRNYKFRVLYSVLVLVNVIKCEQISLEQKYNDGELIAIGSCMVNCGPRQTRKCFDNCSNQAENSKPYTRTISYSFAVELVCRESDKLVLSVEGEDQVAKLNIINIYGVRQEFTLINDVSVIEITNLRPGHAYHVQAIVFTSASDYLFTNTHTVLETMPKNYIPGAINDIGIVSYQPNPQDESFLNAFVGWKPTSDMACQYEILHYSSHSTDFHPTPLQIHQFGGPHQATLESLEFDTEFEVAIRAKNPPLESGLRWTSFHTPSCFDVHNYSQICAPEAITNLSVKAEPLANKHYQLNISWDEPILTPSSYEIHIYDLNPDMTEDLAHSVSLNATGDVTSVFVDAVPVQGTQFEVFVIAHANNRTTSSNLISSIQIQRLTRDHWIDALVVIIIIALLVIGKFLIPFLCKRFARIKRYDKPRGWKGLELSSDIEVRMQNLEGAEESQTLPGELIAPINDGMEVRLEQIQLLDVLGEGAFGLVRKGLLTTKDGESLDVAVKMLKECPSLVDIKAFRREIEVMKSVGSHPNVVCIVGQYTGNVTRMMLLTEYCSGGNLLNYLRDIWNKILKTRSPTCSLFEACETIKVDRTRHSSGYESPRDCCEFDTELPVMVENKLYQHQQKISIQFDNQCYFGEEENKLNLPITSNQLMEFARQIAHGMEFLSRNRVVHRDLAARNILVMDGTTVKISDFGLSRDIYQENMYRKTTNGKLPIKWLALESLTHQMYTSQSDVWSFGIVLYEICTLGGNPYPMLETGNLLLELKGGYRMERPASCCDELYELMTSCWNTLPSERPTFSTVSNRLEKMIEQSKAEGRSLIDLSGIMD
ncbi:tyrosine-protein kinase receptor torso [Aedes albopictus]|uniref:receptor protein-tyrosine kinase n=1 Tax=Aedes albopictus TaxID=7160 RepID=A0ABM1YQ34_AEDAL|nr:tyrosine-protein kinase receptor torso-like [Aedes albopictus]